jgi:hypothetical protein
MNEAFVSAQPGYFLVEIQEEKGTYKLHKVPIVAWRVPSLWPVSLSFVGALNDATFILAPDPDGRVYSRRGEVYPDIHAFMAARIKDMTGKGPP